LKSLRAQLIFFWVILAIVSLGLAAVMAVVFRSSAGAQIDAAQNRAELSCSAIAARYAGSLADPQRDAPQLDLLQVLLQLVLTEQPHVEGGVWRSQGGFLAYAYPTYEGSAAKSDVPPAEQAHIAEVAQVVARTQLPQSDVVRATREALVVSACPLVAPRHDLVAWTMTRTSLGMLDAQRSLRVGLLALLGFVLAAGLWLGAILLRAYRHVQRLEVQLAQADGSQTTAPLAPTGVRELDRVVAALNRYRERFEQARGRLRDAERQQARDQRLAALGRMTGGVAHEIRNPIAAMRLKAENALAGPPERQPQALQVMLEQIARLDGLVQSLLALVQPIQLQLQAVDWPAWGEQRLATLRERAAARGVQLELRAEAHCAMLDPVHLARAVDNLLDNALRHTPAGGQVRLVIQAQEPASVPADAALCIRVDDGPGVPESLQGQLFEPFASGRPDGTGLGLALAREVALAHGGELRYTALPAGARFEMELPWRTC